MNWKDLRGGSWKMSDFKMKCANNHDHSILVLYEFHTMTWEINVDKHELEIFTDEETESEQGYNLGIQEPEEYQKIVKEIKENLTRSEFNWDRYPLEGKINDFKGWEVDYIEKFKVEQGLDSEIDLRKKHEQFYARRALDCDLTMRCNGYGQITEGTCPKCLKEYNEKKKN
jgi:hypothetical protein